MSTRTATDDETDARLRASPSALRRRIGYRRAMHHDTTRPREAAICALKHDPAPEAAGQLVGVVSSSVRAQEHRRRHTRVVSKSARLAALDPRPSGTVFLRSAVATLKEGSMFHSKMVFAAGRLALVTAACGDVQARKHVRRNRHRAVDGVGSRGRRNLQGGCDPPDVHREASNDGQLPGEVLERRSGEDRARAAVAVRSGAE